MRTLRDCGCSVLVMSSLGHGAPDLLVGLRGQNYALEVKDGSLSPSRRQLTPYERRWHNSWRGQVVVVDTVAQALAAVGLASR